MPPNWRRLRRRVARSAALLRYHRPEQFARRLANRLRDPLRRFFPEARPPAVSVRDRTRSPEHHRRLLGEVVAAPLTADDLADGRVTLLNRTRILGADGLDWLPDASPLWTFQLHYHEWLAPPAVAGEWHAVLATLEGWRVAVPEAGRRERVFWHPYCISRRVPVWCRLLAACEGHPARVADLVNDVAWQAAFLSRNLERDIGGNHLWDNAKALTVAGCFFAGTDAERWRRSGLRLLRRCIDDQVNACGEHFERSPSYQADLVRGLRDTADWLRPFDPAAADELSAVADRMAWFLHAILHPDGGVPLFGDCWQTPVPAEGVGHSQELRDRSPSWKAEAQAEGSPRRTGRSPTGNARCVVDGSVVEDAWSRWVGDTFVHRSADLHLIFDAGNMAPDHLPAHGHADLLGFELSLRGQRLLVDSGAYCYQGPERLAFRDSAAHNVCMLDGRVLADVWSSFRMGRRGHVTGRGERLDGAGRWVWAIHDAYAPQPALRAWLLLPRAVVCIDHFPASTLTAEQFLHWHPSVRLHHGVFTWEDQGTSAPATDHKPLTLREEVAEGQSRVPARRRPAEEPSLQGKGSRMEGPSARESGTARAVVGTPYRVTFPIGATSERAGEYAPEFHRRQVNRVTVNRGAATVAWALHHECVAAPAVEVRGDRIVVTFGDTRFAFATGRSTSRR